MGGQGGRIAVREDEVEANGDEVVVMVVVRESSRGGGSGDEGVRWR